MASKREKNVTTLRLVLLANSCLERLRQMTDSMLNAHCKCRIKASNKFLTSLTETKTFFLRYSQRRN